MWRYIVRRLLWTVLSSSSSRPFTYLIFFVMPPTDPAVQFAGKNPTPELMRRQARASVVVMRLW